MASPTAIVNTTSSEDNRVIEQLSFRPPIAAAAKTSLTVARLPSTLPATYSVIGEQYSICPFPFAAQPAKRAPRNTPLVVAEKPHPPNNDPSVAWLPPTPMNGNLTTCITSSIPSSVYTSLTSSSPFPSPSSPPPALTATAAGNTTFGSIPIPSFTKSRPSAMSS